MPSGRAAHQDSTAVPKPYQPGSIRRHRLQLNTQGMARRSSMRCEAVREAVFGRIRDEWQRTVRLVREITGRDTLLADNPALARSIRDRLPYLDPLNHLQVELLHRHRSGKTDDRVKRGIHLTINGIAAGLRNSG